MARYDSCAEISRNLFLNLIAIINVLTFSNYLRTLLILIPRILGVVSVQEKGQVVQDMFYNKRLNVVVKV